MEFFLIIPASGTGSRFGLKTPKQFYRLDGKEILIHTLNRFNPIKRVKSIFVSTRKDYVSKISSLVKKHKVNKVGNVCEGGKHRQDSVYNALKKIECKPNDIIIVHDAVRPFVSEKLINMLMDKAIKHDCVVPGIPITNTIKRTNKNGIVLNTVPRENLWSIQTPQFFKYEKLVKAFELAGKKNIIGTDEAALMEYAGFKVKVIEGEIANIKITTRKDLK
jgi:2-C-methyl-D-erythritol 4-phosphate cytidylyltransferase